MKNMKALIISLIHEESGQDLIEYALIAALISLAAVAGLAAVSTQISAAFTKVSSTLANAV